MDVRNCKTCGRLFNYLQGPQICPACVDNMESKFHEVKEYIRDNPKAPISAVAEENEVTVKQIKQWVREERLSFSEDSAIGLECEKCGKLIKTGRFCNECKSKVTEEMQSAIRPKKIIEAPKPKTAERDRMRFLDK